MSAKYSAGPKDSAQLRQQRREHHDAEGGDQRTYMKELQAEMDSATPPRPVDAPWGSRPARS